MAIVKIHRTTVADADQIASCLEELGYGTSAQHVAQRISELTTSVSDQIFVAHLSGNPAVVGVASAHALPLFHTYGQLVRLTALAVSGTSQGSGVGRSLVTAVERWAWSIDARRVEVTSGDHRPNAHAFYQSVGYSVDERRFIKRAPAVAANGT